jgi:peptide/nickel transport system substrate-binding protein
VTSVRTARALGVALLLTFAACSDGATNPTPPATPTSAVDQVKHGGTIVYATDSEPATFNPRTPKGNTIGVSTVLMRVLPVVWLTAPNLDPVLDRELVTSAEVTSQDPQTITYKINPKAVWSDGVPISADDFIYNWEVTKPGAVDVNDQPIAGTVPPGEDLIDRVTAADDGKTVNVVLKRPFGDWRTLYTRALLPAHIARRVGFNTGFDTFDPAVVISGGPFRIASHNPGRDLTLVRNEKYWGTPSNLDSIVVRFVADSPQMLIALQNGEVQLATPRAQTDLLGQARALPGVRAEVTSSTSQEFVEFNLRNELLAVPQVRRALALSLDRGTILERTVGQFDKSIKVANNRLYHTSQTGYTDTSGGRYDKADVPGAKRMLEDAGFALGPDGIYAKDGKRLSFRLRTTAADELRTTEVELIQAQARLAGFELRVDTFPVAQAGTVARGDFDLLTLSQAFTFPTSAATFFTSGSALNPSGYANKAVDDMIDKARTEPDDAKRADQMRAIDRVLWDDMPRLPLYQRPSFVAVRDTYANVGANGSAGPIWNAERWGLKGP